MRHNIWNGRISSKTFQHGNALQHKWKEFLQMMLALCSQLHDITLTLHSLVRVVYNTCLYK